MALNEEQNRAVKHRGSGLLVLAGAGTGKTRVITHRIADLVEEGVEARRILAVTFTNKAAKEMRARLSKMGVSEDVWIGTFHATGLRMLRMHPELVGYEKNFTIYDDSSQKALVKALLADVDTRGLKVTENLIHSLIQQMKGKDKGPKEVEHEDSPIPYALRRIVREVFDRYEEALLRSNAMDFADLLINTTRLLRNAKGTKAEWLIGRFKHVLVDEFQDTNSVQMEMVDLLASNGETCVVGDDDQCQPEGTMVLTPDGEVPIETLQEGDLVVSWDRPNKELRSNGRKVLKTASRIYEGDLHEIGTPDAVTRATPNHKFFVRWADREDLGATVVYLMYRKDLGYRVGWCQLHRSDGAFHFGQRMKLEKADAGWVLACFRDRSEASIYESVVAVKYGIPTVTFEIPQGGKTASLYTTEGVKRIFAAADTASGSRCLREHWLQPHLPFWPPPDPGKKHTVFQCYAANILPDLMLVPSMKSRGEWEKITRKYAVSYQGEVHSLEVEKDGTYVADGVVTHNSIYGWRGANPDGMMDFNARPGVELVKLEENYRCTKPILDCANAVIANNSKRLGKTLRPNKDGDLVRVTLLYDERSEAKAVADSIKAPWENHAILYRTHVQSRPLEEALRLQAIPYTIVGGLRFYDRAEIKDVLAYFRLAVNPKADMDLLRVANVPSRGMGPKKMGALKTAAAKKRLTMFEALKDSDEEKSLALRKILIDLAKAKNTAFTLLDFYDSMMTLTGYKAALEKTTKSKSLAQRDKAQQKLDNVNELANDLSEYTMAHPGATVDDYLEHVALVSSFDKESGPSVCLMTIHASKGLEFPHIHLVGFEDKILPHFNSIKAADEMGKHQEIEEERRLTYVAITRAKDQLDITLAQVRSKSGRREIAIPSRFLKELPKGRHTFKGVGL